MDAALGARWQHIEVENHQVVGTKLEADVAYAVPEGWVGYGTWVANTACTKMVGIEIPASDWFPLSHW